MSSDHKEIRSHIQDYYQKIYTNEPINLKLAHEILSHTNVKVPENKQKGLTGNFTPDELAKALLKTEKGKAPGLDGIPYEFYESFWYVVGDDLTEVINFVFDREKLTKSQRKAVITLISKKNEKTKIENWRPISLLNCDLKIATKTIANRMEDIMPTITKPTQTCAIKGKQMHHHALLIRDIISCAKITGKPTYILSFDQEKAFDKVN